ncbi:MULTISPECIES: thiol peroxidase [Kocuria]|uniref:thiol peroxidase n=1 Tax=Kocuria TaxID=57493 RepID=UPI0021A61957|nr:thiol peroxidase [Kocuria rhizophila]MCT1544911.1 thiol peroxidase [Kocuria rhizophila]MCT1915977.1 thiol peroxidase [Kocuria rhizophila]MCT2171258.1 thiol peroxidase [Kocuria rhizophila]
MAETAMQGNPVHTVGELPAEGTSVRSFDLVGADLGPVASDEFTGQRMVLNIFPSLDTGVCAQSVREFNQRASELQNTTVLCVSKDLPFAQARFCGTEGLDNVVTASAFRSSFGEDYGVTMTDGPLQGLLARAVVVVDENGQVVHSQLVPEISQEPDYDAAVAALS